MKALRETSGGRFDADVVLVGGGPAGTSTALHLTRAEKVDGSRVVLLDKARHPREKPCAGAVSAWGLSALRDIGIPLEVPSAPMLGVRVLVGDEAGAIAMPLGVVIRRSEFDASLWNRAKAEGVRAYDGEALVAIERIHGGFELRTRGERGGTPGEGGRGRVLTTRYLAACDGAGSSVRKLLAIRETSRKGHLYVLETETREIDRGPRAFMCDFDLSPADDGIEGYYWDFPTVIDGAPAVSRGIYHANLTRARGARRDGAPLERTQVTGRASGDPSGTRGDAMARASGDPSTSRGGITVKEALARSLARRGIDMTKVKLKPFSTRPFEHGSVLWQDRLMLVGEAAGIDATTGEGIAQAILFGRMAAHHLAMAFRSGATTFEGYDRDVRRDRIGRHLLQSARMARVVYGPGGEAARRFLLRSRAAREAGARWYEGADLGLLEKARVASELARDAAFLTPGIARELFARAFA